LGGVRYRREKSLTILENGRAIRCRYREIDHRCDRFKLVDAWLDEKGAQRCGRAGHGEARLARARAVVEVVLWRLAADETVFLHEPGVDIECDEARASIPAL
jgi:aminoglycoside N3'-acetyltransferase